MKEEILRRISDEEKKLDDRDANGHIWWNKFREFIESIPEPKNKMIIQTCDNCASDYYRHKEDEKHEVSQMYLCSRCESQW